MNITTSASPVYAKGAKGMLWWHRRAMIQHSSHTRVGQSSSTIVQNMRKDINMPQRYNKKCTYANEASTFVEIDRLNLSQMVFITHLNSLKNEVMDSR